MAEIPSLQPWPRRPVYKYGMLGLIVCLLLLHVWTLWLDGPGTVDGARIGLVVIGMLMVNHVSFVFMTQQQQRRFRPLQWALILGGLAYVALQSWREIGGR